MIFQIFQFSLLIFGAIKVCRGDACVAASNCLGGSMSCAYSNEKYCLTGCIDGYYGLQCDLECPSGCANDKCHRTLGSCVGGCVDGFYGLACNQSCPEASYALYENTTCIRCKQETGACVELFNASALFDDVVCATPSCDAPAEQCSTFNTSSDCLFATSNASVDFAPYHCLLTTILTPTAPCDELSPRCQACASPSTDCPLLQVERTVFNNQTLECYYGCTESFGNQPHCNVSCGDCIGGVCEEATAACFIGPGASSCSSSCLIFDAIAPCLNTSAAGCVYCKDGTFGDDCTQDCSHCATVEGHRCHRRYGFCFKCNGGACECTRDVDLVVRGERDYCACDAMARYDVQSRACLACPSNLIQNPNDESSCVCDQGHYYDSITHTCTFCSAGSFCPGLGNDSSFECDEWLQSSPGAVECQSCRQAFGYEAAHPNTDGSGCIEFCPTGYGASSDASESLYYNELIGCAACRRGTACAWSSVCVSCLPCLPADESIIQCDGNDSWPIVSAGYWVGLDNNATSIIVRQCISIDVCRGGSLLNASLQCAETYEGVACRNCIENYFYYRDECRQCPKSSIFLVMGVVAFAAGVILLAIFVANRFKAGTAVFVGVITQVQLLAVFGSYSLRWHPWMFEMFDLFNIFNLNIDTAGPACIAKSLENYGVRFFIFTAVIMAATAFFMLPSRFFKKHWRMRVRRAYWQSYRIAYISIVTTSFSAFRCRPEPDDTASLLADQTITCWRGVHVAMVAVAAIFGVLFLSIGVPVYWFYRLRAERRLFLSGALRKGTSEARTDISFLYYEYRAKEAVPLTAGASTMRGMLRQLQQMSNRFHLLTSKFTLGERVTLYWSFSVLLKKLLLSLLVWLPMSGASQAATALAIMLMTLALQLLVRPYNFREGNVLETANMVILVTVLVFGLVMDGNDDNLLGQVLSVVTFVLVGASTVIGVMLTLRVELRVRQMRKMTEKATKLLASGPEIQVPPPSSSLSSSSSRRPSRRPSTRKVPSRSASKREVPSFSQSSVAEETHPKSRQRSRQDSRRQLYDKSVDNRSPKVSPAKK